MAENRKLSHNEIDKLVDILADQAATSMALSPQGYFRDLVRRTKLPSKWKRRLAGAWTGDPESDARKLVEWAEAKGINPAERELTTLGTLLQVLLEDDVGLEERSWLAALITVHKLYRDESLLNSLVMRYQIPEAFDIAATERLDVGPEINWRGSTDEIELQGWLPQKPDFQDVGFLARAIEQAASVCRIEIPTVNRQGTGFLITPTRLLTSYHILKNQSGEDIQENVRNAVLRFGKLTAADGEEAKGQEFKLVPDEPILASSPVGELDYVLLQLEESIKDTEGVKPAPYTLELPHQRIGMNILQHPRGEALKLALNGNGVVNVYENEGLVQYLTRAQVGSSGAPCFTDDWQVIAVHHAQRSKGFGTIREGILFRSIYEKIEQFL